ncbi:MAG: DUF2125 domain-containing protein [Pseudolabrys sp.]
MTGSGPRRGNRRYVILLVLVGLLFGGWSAVWYYAAGIAQETIAGWRAREAAAGRVYACGTESLAGYPFRIEVTCEPASAVFRAFQPALEIRSAGILVAAQIYQPNLLISEFTAPLTVAAAGERPSLSASWTLGRSSVRGTPAAPERVSLVFDGLMLEALSGANRDRLVQAKHVELHGRMAEGSVADNPVIEAALNVEGAIAPLLHPAAADPMDADIVALLRGLRDFAPKPWAARFREIQAAGGRIDIAQARLRQGDILAVGAGSLTLNANGRLDGQLKVTVAGLDQFLEKIGAQRIVQNSPAVDRLAGMLDRLSPGLGQAARQQAGANLSAGINMLGEQATLEGRRAVTVPLRFQDGAAFLGPVPIGNTPALF